MIEPAASRPGSSVRRKLLLTLPLALMLCGCSTPPFGPVTVPAANPHQAPVDQPLIPLNSAEGETLLFDSDARADYLPLSIHFETQQNLAYCGVASMAMVLNAMEIPAPIAPEYKHYPVFTQNNLFNDKTGRIVSIQTIARQGMTLEELGRLLAAHALDTQMIFGSDSSPDRFRRLAVENLKQPGNFILVNYLRSAIGQKTGGHISPLAAYHESSDRFLILDVSRFKYPPVWIKTEHLWRAMNTLDHTSGKTRGFVLIGRPSNALDANPE
ncbi:MAG: phytochelatin synthase family protein [Gammaproteobacteria bacterium]